MTGDKHIEMKGEFVLAVEGQQTAPSSIDKIDLNQLLRELSAVLPGRQAADIAARVTGRGRNEIYRLMLAQRDDAGED